MRCQFIVAIAALTAAVLGPTRTSGAQPPAEQPAAKADGAPIAIVLEKSIYLKDIHPDETDKTALRDYQAIVGPILSPLFAKYVKEQRLAATKLEIKSFRKWIDSSPNRVLAPADEKLTPEDNQAIDEMARFSVEEWKVNKSLYEKYGGRVEFQQAGLEPLDAYQNWLRDEEKAGNFKIIDPKWRDAFWEYYKPKYHRHFSKEPNPFQVPPWET